MRVASRTVASLVHPVTRRWTRTRDGAGVTMVGWHRVDGTAPAGLSTGVPEFGAHLDQIVAAGATVLPLGEAVRMLREGRRLPPRAVVLTFDDGYASVVDTAWPLLRERGWPATLFVVIDGLESAQRFHWDAHEPAHPRHRLATWGQVLEASAEGLDIGSHTRTHPWLPGLSDADLTRELAESRSCLEEMLGREVLSVAYPSGGWDRRVRAAAGRAGYEIAITVDRGLNTRHTHPLSLRRAFVPDSVADLQLILDGAYTYLRPLDTWRNRRGAAW